MRDLNIVLIQEKLAWQAPAENRARFETLLRHLDEPADLVVLPEMFTTGFTLDAAANAETVGGATSRWMADMAGELGITLCGSLIVEDAGHYYNRLLWVTPDGRTEHYDKRHLFRMAGEHRHFSAGMQRRIFELHGWRICPLICYDLRFPVWSRGAAAFDLLLYVANWPAARRQAWRTLLPARAVENQCYVAGVNRIGVDGNNVRYTGDSGVFDFLGNTFMDCGGENLVAPARLERADLDEYREKFPAFLDADRFTLLADEPAGTESGPAGPGS